MAHNCYYVYTNGTGVNRLNGTTLPVGFSGTGLSVECGKNTQTEEEKQTECKNSDGMVWYNNQCITQAQHNCITSPGTWTGSACTCNSGYHLDNQKCVANTYTIKYVANGGSGTMSDTTCTYGKTCILADNKFTNTGYEFFAWQYLGSNYAENADVTNITTKEETLTFKAVWRETQESCEAAGKKWYNNGYCITEEEYNNAQLCGKDGGGWIVGEQRCACPADTEWVADTGCVSTVYTLTLDQTSGSGGDSTATYKKGGSAFCDNYGWCEKGIVKPYINGYEFQGYFTEKTGGTQWINEKGFPVNSTIITESRTLYAQYKARTYTCSAGTYLNVTTCEQCTSGYYCLGGKFTYDGYVQGLGHCPENSSSEAGAAWCECDEGYVSSDSSEGHTTTSCYAASSCSLDNIKNTMDANPCVLGDLVTQTGTNGNSVQGYLVTGAAGMTAEACCAAAGAILSSGSFCACEKLN